MAPTFEQKLFFFSKTQYVDLKTFGSYQGYLSAQRSVNTESKISEPNKQQAENRIHSHHSRVSSMAGNIAESLVANSSRETRSVFYCPKSPEFTWHLNHTTFQKITLAVTTIACPVTILLNLLVIIAVKTRRELKKNSNILLSRLAAIDLLVGAVSMPLTIALDALVLQKILFVEMFCTIDIISVSATGYSLLSFFSTFGSYRSGKIRSCSKMDEVQSTCY